MLYISRSLITGMTTVDFIQEAVEHNKVVVFSRTDCPYCETVKDVLKKTGVRYKLYELNDMGKPSMDLYCIAQLMTSI